MGAQHGDRLSSLGQHSDLGQMVLGQTLHPWGERYSLLSWGDWCCVDGEREAALGRKEVTLWHLWRRRILAKATNIPVPLALSHQHPGEDGAVYL